MNHDPVPSAEKTLTQHRAEIDQVRAHVHASPSADTHFHHGPGHWARVEAHALLISQSLGISPLVPVLFAWVHDSQRMNDDVDPWHGLRAAKFVKENRAGLFAFLSDSDWMTLQEACKKPARSTRMAGCRKTPFCRPVGTQTGLTWGAWASSHRPNTWALRLPSAPR